MRRALHLPSRISVTTRPEDLAIHFRLALEELEPTSVKFGQILPTRPDLPPPENIAEWPNCRMLFRPSVAWLSKKF